MKIDLIKYIRQTALAFIIGYPLLAGYIYFSTKYSEEFQVAVAYAQKSAEIRAKLGEINDASLPLFGGIHIEYTGDYGNAEFKLNLRGNKAKGQVQFNLRRTNGIWQVEDVTILTVKNV